MTKEASGAATSLDPIHVLVLSLHHDMGVNFVQTVCPESTGGSGHALIDGQNYDLDVLASEPDDPRSWEKKIEWSDAVVLQVRFMDAISLERIKTMCQRLPTKPPLPLAVFLLREESEIDFKMSCPSCSQKLWVRDTDENKRGRCPNCKKAFRLPTQAQHTMTELGLSDGISVTRITRGNPSSCRKALDNLKHHLVGGIVATESVIDREGVMKSTARIEVQNTDTQAGEAPAAEG